MSVVPSVPMKRLQNHLIGVDQGEVALFSDFENNGPMWSETGAREARQTVKFSAAFRKPPSVQVSMALWDVHQDSAVRSALSAENIGEHSFDVVFRTWSDTRIARIRASWMAIGELPHDDDWDLY